MKDDNTFTISYARIDRLHSTSLTSSTRKVEKKSFAWLNQFCRSLMQPSMTKLEPRVWQQRDRQGKLWWHLYDPGTCQAVRLESEEAARIWLEQRYYLQASNSIQQP
ncbi:hypothetical protein IFO70_08925 [Phormidium tenue FACHB-886]|nr:hypothetical protein [Phormidium tenue FACHB-886]